jgi:hypothetical protein
MRWWSKGRRSQKHPVTVGVARWVGAVTVVRIDGVYFPALGPYEKDYATYGYDCGTGYDYGTRNPEQTYSTPDLCVSAYDSRN